MDFRNFLMFKLQNTREQRNFGHYLTIQIRVLSPLLDSIMNHSTKSTNNAMAAPGPNANILAQIRNSPMLTLNIESKTIETGKILSITKKK